MFFFFKFSFIYNVWAVVFELHEGSIYSFVKFEVQSISSKIERAFDKMNQKMGQKTMN